MRDPKQPGWKASAVASWTDGDDTESMELDSHIAYAISIVEGRRHERLANAGFDSYDEER